MQRLPLATGAVPFSLHAGPDTACPTVAVACAAAPVTCAGETTAWAGSAVASEAAGAPGSPAQSTPRARRPGPRTSLLVHFLRHRPAAPLARRARARSHLSSLLEPPACSARRAQGRPARRAVPAVGRIILADHCTRPRKVLHRSASTVSGVWSRAPDAARRVARLGSVWKPRHARIRSRLRFPPASPAPAICAATSPFSISPSPRIAVCSASRS